MRQHIYDVTKAINNLPIPMKIPPIPLITENFYKLVLIK